MTLERRQKDLCERNSATILESVPLGGVVNLPWVRVYSRTGSVPMWASYIYPVQDLLGSRAWASLSSSTAKDTEKNGAEGKALAESISIH